MTGVQSASLGSRRRLNWGPVSADSDDRDLRYQAAIVSQAKNSPCMFLCFFLGNKLLGWANRFRRQKLNSVICHVIIPWLRLPYAADAVKRPLPYRQELGKAVHR